MSVETKEGLILAVKE